LPMKTRPRSMDTASPNKKKLKKKAPRVRGPVLFVNDQLSFRRVHTREKVEWRRETYVPAERNTICSVRGTLNANTRLFSSVPDANVVTWRSHCVMGT
jgi:hypothetical protein